MEIDFQVRNIKNNNNWCGSSEKPGDGAASCNQSVPGPSSVRSSSHIKRSNFPKVLAPQKNILSWEMRSNPIKWCFWRSLAIICFGCLGASIARSPGANLRPPVGLMEYVWHGTELHALNSQLTRFFCGLIRVTQEHVICWFCASFRMLESE